MLPSTLGHRAHEHSSRYDRQSKRKSISRLWLVVPYLAAVLSSMKAVNSRRRFNNLYETLKSQTIVLSRQIKGTQSALSDLSDSRKSLEVQLRKLERSGKLFRHELRMEDEVSEAVSEESSEDANQDSRRKKGVLMNHVYQRHELLKGKLSLLQSYVQDQSKLRLLEKYGKGPYRVKFSVKPTGSKKVETFRIELAPLGVMPHSSLTFLDMVSSGLWDNTVFYHHKSAEHVIAAAPVEHGTFEPKHHHIEAMGYTGLSFAEYSPSFPHSEYTVGFSGKGPNFYINTMDNSEHHGPGGQGHHDLPDDADPCFAKVISGKKVIQKMKKASARQEKLSAPATWRDYDLSHIVKLELVQ